MRLNLKYLAKGHYCSGITRSFGWHDPIYLVWLVSGQSRGSFGQDQIISDFPFQIFLVAMECSGGGSKKQKLFVWKPILEYVSNVNLIADIFLLYYFALEAL